MKLTPASPFPEITAPELQKILAPHLALYQTKLPSYQTIMLNSLRRLWLGHHSRLLDIGGGTGVIAEAIAQIFPVDEVHAIDVVDRFCPNLSVSAQSYDGQTIPFANRHFDAATLNNVLHHVPIAARANLLREIRRCVDGPLYIKDHLRRGFIDHLRLTALDAIGNIPFGGMLWARYLSLSEWQDLAAQSGWQIAEIETNIIYRNAPYAWVFPNRLEVTMRFDPS